MMQSPQRLLYLGGQDLSAAAGKLAERFSILHCRDAASARDEFVRGGPFDVVVVESDSPPGERSTFIQWVRTRAPETALVVPPGNSMPAAETIQTLMKIGAHSQTSSAVANDTSTSSESTPPVSPAKTRRVFTPNPSVSRVLVVDDDRAVVQLIEDLLTFHGYQVMTASNGVEALKILHEHGAQIVVADWLMPEMDGLELCRAIRGDESTGFVYVVMISAHGDKNCLLDSFEAGADDFLKKPFDGDELLVRMQAGARIVKLEADLAKKNRDITRQNAEMAMLNAKLERLATTDALTDLLNRRHAISKLDELWRLSVRYNVPFSCVMFDIDRFKSVNDTYGHSVGDAVLKYTAAAAQRAVRSVDILARIGGEEFLVLCPNTDAAGANVLAERLRSNIETNPVPHQGEKVKVTISLGVAQLRPALGSADQLLQEVDEALYEAKRSGRNCVCVAGKAAAQAACPTDA